MEQNPSQTGSRDASKGTSDLEGPQNVRCCCGSLLAKLVEGGVELKCRRCKSIVLVPFDPADAGDDIRIGNEKPEPRSS